MLWLVSKFTCSIEYISCNQFCALYNVWVGVRAFSKVVVTFSHVGGSFNLSIATARWVWIIPFWLWDNMLYVQHISWVITNCGQHQWTILSLFSITLEALLEKNITRKMLRLSPDLFFKILLFQVAFLISLSIAVFSSYFFWLVCYSSMGPSLFPFIILIVFFLRQL